MMSSIKPEDFMTTKDRIATVLDIRRDNDYEASGEIIPDAVWKNPAKIDDWISSVPNEGQVVIYCVRGGGVSNSVVDRLQKNGVVVVQ